MIVFNKIEDEDITDFVAFVRTRRKRAVFIETTLTNHVHYLQHDGKLSREDLEYFKKRFEEDDCNFWVKLYD